MNTSAVYHRKNFARHESWVKKAWAALEMEKGYRFVISLVAFIISVVPASLAVCFASVMRNEIFLTLIVTLSVLTLAFCIAGTPLKVILLTGLLSFFASVSAIIYSLTAYNEALEPYL